MGANAAAGPVRRPKAASQGNTGGPAAVEGAYKKTRGHHPLAPRVEGDVRPSKVEDHSIAKPQGYQQSEVKPPKEKKKKAKPRRKKI